MVVRIGIVGMVVSVSVMLSGIAHASSWSCSRAELVLVDEAAGTCAALPEADGVRVWTVGERLGVEGGECESCPTPVWGPDVGEETPDCTIEDPWIEVRRDDTSISTSWTYGADGGCSPLALLTTDLEPGDYVVQVNGDQSWTVRLVAASDDLGPAPDDTQVGGDAGTGATEGGGCASGAGHQAPTLAWLVLLLAAPRLRRRVVWRG